MLERIQGMYGPNENDISELHNEFQNFQYDASKSLQENACRMQVIQDKLQKLGDNVSDFAFRTRLLNSLPKKFGSFVAASNLNRNISLKELIAGLVAKGIMTNNYKETYAPVTSITSVRTFSSIAIYEDMIIKRLM